MNDRFALRVAEAALALGISRAKAYELIASGQIPSIRIGGCIRVPVEQLRDWLERQAVDAVKR
jgi:excisionase family DNA binding protein